MELIVDEKKRGTKLPIILRAALECFTAKGIHATTTKEIADRAGVSEGAIYRHYAGKQALAEDLYITHLDYMTSLLEKRLPAEDSLREKLYTLVEGCFRFFDEDPSLFSYLILSEHSELGKTTRKVRHIRHLILDILNDGRSRGEVRDTDLEVLSACLIGMIIRVAVFRIYGLVEGKMVVLAPEVAEACCRVAVKEA